MASPAIANPQRTLLDLYASENDVDVDTFPSKVAAHFAQIFTTPDAFHEIPVLDVLRPPTSHADRSLVRFRAMVQDTSPSPEIYLARRRNGHTSGWGLFADTFDGRDDDEVDYSDLRECSVMWAVSVPGESEWCRDPLSDGQTGQRETLSVQSSRGHKYPQPETLHIGVQLKLYDSAHASSIKSTDLHNFVGILTHEPLHNDGHDETESTVHVPTLHVLFSKPLPSAIIPRAFPFRPPEKDSSTTELRQALIHWIADEGLAGDLIAAEWVLLCALAKVESRSPPIFPPSLTLARFPSPPGASDSSVHPTLPVLLSMIFPIVTRIPLSLSTLNSTSFAPESKDEDLHSGPLQLPSGSVMCISESGIREGGINDKGIMNIRAIQEVINNQTLDYVFPYSRFSFQTDIVCITICEGRKSTFFQTSLTIPLQPQCPQNEVLEKLYQKTEDIERPSEEMLEAFRALVGGAKIGSVTVGETVAQYIQDDFVRERKESSTKKEKITSDDLIIRMTIARLLALSHHSEEVTAEIWEEAKKLEAARHARVAAMNDTVAPAQG